MTNSNALPCIHPVDVFRNEPPIDFSFSSEVARFEEALRQVRSAAESGSLKAAPLIGGKSYSTDNTDWSVNPSRFEERLGQVHYATPSQVEQAILSLEQHQRAWREVEFKGRAGIIKKAADLMRSKRYELAALMVLEAGKPWAEADADVCEAIDFCDYYAVLAESMANPEHLMPYLNGELNHYSYAPRGVAAVISPWNFPFAIAAGMTVAALVCGNTTLLKPAEQTSLIAQELAKILLDAGVLPGAFALLPGIGEEIGPQIVSHKSVHLIAFTGSRQVGLEILKNTSSIQPGQNHIKKVILELGGKNAIIVDEDADFDEAIKGVLYSAFGFAGQKCSACSRVLVLQAGYERFLERLIAAANDLIVAPSEQPETFVGPLIDENSQQRVLRLINDSKQRLSLAYSGQCPKSGYFVPITIFKDVPTTDPLWREEAFAPVLCVRPVATFEEAIKQANDSDYALTGGVFSRSPLNLAYAREHFEVGNLYLNRGITGAIVGRQPFGGFRMSGIGSKAGGKDYLLQFVEPRSVTENTMRKGFTPELAK